ncbi:MAG: carboxypeptidase regulatory-like domain-containing protein [Nitrospiraceae bacterium]|nr:MAG: carboxypeptidase regulatory-like domain-containing protein [Nitrospiraceae bacterium]
MAGKKYLVWFFVFILAFAGTSYAGNVTVFGPAQYTTTQGGTDVFTDTFSAISGEARITVRNGTLTGTKRIDNAISSARVYVNGTEIFSPNDFNQNVYLLESPINVGSSNSISIALNGSSGRYLTVEITQQVPEPTIAITANPDTIHAGNSSTLTWNSTFADNCVISPGVGDVSPSGSVEVSPAETTTYTVTATGLGGSASANVTVTVTNTGGQLPPDPADVAPPLDKTAATPVYDQIRFLYTGNNPIQTGVEPETIEMRRAAVLRGLVKNREGNPLPGVTITVLDHPEFGRTLTRADGMFDMAVNGGGYLTVTYEKDGYLPVQRTTDVPWQDFKWMLDVVLIELDPQVTTVYMGMSEMQVAQGSVVTDDDGTRQATLIFPQGAQAEMTFPDGSIQPLTTLSVRATEYTVGANGPQAMPGELPPTSGYTYAVELSVDEAIAAGAKRVDFLQPVFFYVENFLNFPVGGIVPVGYYDRDRAAWIPSDNGRIIQILSVSNGIAELDVDGSGLPADSQTLADLGITTEERVKLAGLYSSGESLWRVPVRHFTPWDCNWPFGPPMDAEAPKLKIPEADPKLDDPCLEGGSVIECDNQVLGESIGLTGSPFSLHYRSDRVLGRKTAYQLDIPLSGESIPAGLKRIDLEITVAGRKVIETFPPLPYQKYIFTWDRKNAYGQEVQGTQAVYIRIGYVYGAVYYQPVQFGSAFARVSGIPISSSRARKEVTLWQEQATLINAWNALDARLGGWTLNMHHAYDPLQIVLTTSL